MKNEVQGITGNEVSQEDSTAASPSIEVNKKSRKGCGTPVLVALLSIMFVLFMCFLTLPVLFVLSIFTTPASSSQSAVSADEVYIYDGVNDDKIAIIHVQGVITDSSQSASTFDGIVTSDEVIADLNAALEDDNVKAIILEIESPGGEVVASDKIYRSVLEARDEKPIVAYSSNIAASGGYYIAAGADEFVTHPGAITGSIGVILQTQSLDGLYEKLGIETVTFKSGDLKDDAELYDDDPNGELENVYQALVDEYYEDFLSAILEGREDMDEAELRQLADGRVYSGQQALDRGLVDSNGYRTAAIARAEELAGISDSDVVEYQRFDFFGSLFSFGMIAEKAGIVATPQNLGVKAYYLVEL